MKGLVKFIQEVGNDLAKEVGSKAAKGEDFELKVQLFRHFLCPFTLYYTVTFLSIPFF